MKDEKKNELVEKLKQWGVSIELCKNKEFEIRRIRKMVGNISNGQETDEVTKNTIRLFNQEINRLCKEIENCIDERRKIGEAMAMLSPLEQNILRLRYFEGYNWTAVSRKAYICDRHAYSIHNSAICKLLNLV